MAQSAGTTEKTQSSQFEGKANYDALHGARNLVAPEDEPESPYQLSRKTILAFLALAMGNVCAALANTVQYLGFPYLVGFFSRDC